MNFIEQIRIACENNNIVAIRGLNGINADKKYKKNQYLAKSLDLNNDGDEAIINSNTKKLKGTCGCIVTSEMSDNSIIEAVKNILQYAWDNKVILITSEFEEDGEDYNEHILYNEVGFDFKGANFIEYLNIPTDMTR